ncbi:MAG: ROK family protein [Planctomycetota bacterium]
MSQIIENRNYVTHQTAKPPYFVGVDLGGTNIKVAVVDNLGRSFEPLKVATEANKGPEHGTQRMAKAVTSVIRKAGLKPADIAMVGLGSPGTMDIPAGMLVRPVNLKGWDDFPIRDKLAEYCGLPVAFENDANAAAYGEKWVGGGKGHPSLVLFTLGTGIGCGIIIGDVVVQGQNSHGAECGHIVIDYAPDARLCGCGQSGHLEAYASATAVTRRMCEALDAKLPTSLAKRVEEGAILEPKLLAEEAEKGDAFALRLILETASYLAVGVVNLMHTIDPSVVLLGGAMTFGGRGRKLGRKFLARVREEVKRRTFEVLAKRTTIDFARLGGDAGYIGAAGIARLCHLQASRT